MGKKYIVSLHEDRADNTAGSKAKDDITSILRHDGYTDLPLYLSDNKVKSISKNFVSLGKALLLTNVDTIVFQYPIYSAISTKMFLMFLNMKKATRKVCFVHDVESIRDHADSVQTNRERDVLNQFDCLIVHNAQMRTFLTKMGVVTPMVEIELFDYLNTEPMIKHPNRYLTFAGNLKKAAFLGKLNVSTPMKIFGPNPLDAYPETIKYEGSFSPEELSAHLDGRLGLIWDGDSPRTGAGIYGKYMRINNPHKASLYISMGIPVIVWSEAAIAEAVDKFQVGISLDTLTNLDFELAGISEDRYAHLKENAEQLGEKLRQGFFTLRALNRALVLSSERHI
ncbi:sugar transferase [Lacticaseibacillus pantheris]